MSTPLVGGLEAGGTKMVCVVGTGPDDLSIPVFFPTTTPAETLGRIVDYFAAHDLAAVGVGSFGPADIDPDSPTWGHITSTPKPGWSDTNVAGPLARALGVPVAFDTDTNVAALAEGRWGAAQGLDSFVYLTVGTGIGGGGFVGGRRIGGRSHPEIGHLPIAREQGDAFPGICPFHGDCLEGLAAGPAIEARWGRPGHELPPDHPAWPVEARALGRGLLSLILTLAPERIVLGGGVMNQPHLLPLVRDEVRALMNGYLPLPDLDRMIVPTGLDGRAGVLGAVALAQQMVNAGRAEGD